MQSARCRASMVLRLATFWGKVWVRSIRLMRQVVVQGSRVRSKYPGKATRFEGPINLNTLDGPRRTCAVHDNSNLCNLRIGALGTIVCHACQRSCQFQK